MTSNNLTLETFDLNNDIENNISKLKGNRFSTKVINKIQDEINKIALLKEFLFLNAKYDLIVVDNNKIDVIFEFENLENIFSNSSTSLFKTNEFFFTILLNLFIILSSIEL